MGSGRVLAAVPALTLMASRYTLAKYRVNLICFALKERIEGALKCHSWFGAAYDVRFAGLLVSSGDAVAETAIAKTTGTGNN